MELMRLGDRGAERPAVRANGTTYDLSPLTDDIGRAFFASDGVERVREALGSGRLAPLPDVETLRIGPPVANPSAVVCIGQNYAAHAAESGSPPPENPIVFFKHPSCVVGPDDDVVLPPGSVKTDWEVELVVVIGKRADRIGSVDDALAHVAGYTIGNDVSERHWQLDLSVGQWSKGKCFPTFGPLGPSVVTDDLDPASLAIRSWVNDEPRQDSTTADLIFSVPYLVWHLSQCMILEPGDLVFTGTPEGVALSGRFPYLAQGDTVALEIESLGRQTQAVVTR
ncbi:fumarylacetoacetate hydrolase family protein [Solicola gregarius]|uniref:Fumarylacetoacetate hydrolase family protein n=1 Tax=Solicola gregarius TaxID=2908642 RepID=A0AA46YLF9_9ACTN|nr:fumarylacetoacetate hydrolase family protein [Solicola gregarius]UYM06582.1 fumarylacetoacetate hydrolase family protein [Solicola gregarius]